MSADRDPSSSAANQGAVLRSAASGFSRKATRGVGWLDVVALAAVVTPIAYVAWQATYVLNYRWDWAAILDYVVRYDPTREQWVPNLILFGLASTIRIAIWAALLALTFGCVMGVCRVSRSLYFRMISRTYVELVRNIPPLVFIFIAYFFLASQVIQVLGIEGSSGVGADDTSWLLNLLFGESRTRAQLVAATISLAIFQGAYVTEIVRAGIQSIGIGQWEAAASLGVGWRRTMRLVILPQAITRVLPPLAGQLVSLVKETSIVSLLAVPELAFLGNEVATASKRSFEAWITISLMYLGLCLVLSRTAARLERRLAPTNL